MISDKFAEQFRASLGDKAEAFAKAFNKLPLDEIVDAPKVALDKYEYEELAVSWKETGIKEERDALREIIKTELLWKTQDEGFIGALEWMLGELNARDARDATEQVSE